MKLLDLFCGAGGCAVGYYRAGFHDITGVDINPQKNYPYHFIQADALEYLVEHGHEYDFIHASPPCQAYSKSKRLTAVNHPMLVEPTRALLQATGKPYVIENVPGSPLKDPVYLAGQMFGLMTTRERLFECSFDVPFMLVPPPAAKQTKMGRKPKAGDYIQIVGHFSDIAYARKAMGIDWMTQKELAQAIPPAYTQYIGEQFMAQRVVV